MGTDFPTGRWKNLVRLNLEENSTPKLENLDTRGIEKADKLAKKCAMTSFCRTETILCLKRVHTKKFKIKEETDRSKFLPIHGLKHSKKSTI